MKFAAGYCSHLARIVDRIISIPPSEVFLLVIRTLGPLAYSLFQPFCLAVVSMRSNASSRGRSVAKQRVIDVGGGLGPSSSLSLEPRNSMPSQVAEAMGSLRMRSRCLARAEYVKG